MNDALLDRIKRLEERLDVVEKTLQLRDLPTTSTSISLSQKDLLALPSSLQKTMLAIQELQEATSTGVSQETGRARSVETIYLNQLARLGYLNKERKGRKIFFKILRYY
jgi:predicted transcriptional regulator